MFSEEDEGFMRMALGFAENALRNDWIPVGVTFVGPSGAVIAHGTKDGTKHPRFDHAEHNGCYEALWAGRAGLRDLSGVTVYSTMEPCVMCMSMLMSVRVERIVYAMEDSYGGGSFILRSPELPARFQTQLPQLEGGCLREESRTLLRMFFASATGGWGNQENPLVQACL